MKRHVETVHERQKHFQCEFCRRNFSTPGNLKRHIMTLHKENKAENAIQPQDDEKD